MANIQNAVTVQEVESDLFELQSEFRRKRVLEPVDLWGLGELNGEKCFLVWKGLLKCYIPFSETGLKTEDEMIFMLGTKVPVLVTEIDRQQVSVTLSMVKAKEILAAETRKDLKVNDVRTGIVLKLTKRTVTLDLGGVEALLHRDDAAWSYVGHMKDVFRLGQEVRVKITKLETDGSVHVSKKVLEQDPWPTITNQFTLRQPCVAEVTGRNEHGVFLRLQEGVVAMAPFQRTVQINPGQRVLVVVEGIKDKKRVNCRVIRVID